MSYSPKHAKPGSRKFGAPRGQRGSAAITIASVGRHAYPVDSDGPATPQPRGSAGNNPGDRGVHPYPLPTEAA
jgi:hypothetical protein